MAQRVDRPYWYNWLRWHLIDSRRTDNVPRRRAIWHFFNYLRVLPPGSIAIDAGANVGNVTTAFVHHRLRVHAFEPDPWACGKLQQRFHGNPLVEVHAAAVGAHAGSATLYRSAVFEQNPAKSSLGSTLYPRAGKQSAFSVPVIDLCDFIRNLGEPVSILKMDVEGAEVEIVERLIAEGLHSSVGMVYVETHERHSPELARSTEALRQRVRAEGLTNINLDWH